MISNFKRAAAIFGVVAASSTALVACGGNDAGNTENNADGKDNGNGGDSSVELPGGYKLSGATGELIGEGASSQQNAIDYFGNKFQETTGGDASLAYNPTGSGSGQTQFVDGQVTFAGSDSPLDDEQAEKAKDRCNGNEAWHLPFVIGPVAIAYNLKGVDSLNLSTDTVAKIFKGDIKKWNDPEIAEQNKDADLPDTDIHVIYRSDESGTSDNFQKFLHNATDEWEPEKGKTFPTNVGEGANGSSGVTTQVSQIDGAITYVEYSHARQNNLNTAKIDFGAGPVELNNESVGKALDNLEYKGEGNNMVVDSKALFASKNEGAYPLILTTYEIVCSGGYEEDEANLLKDFLMTSLAHQDESLEEAGHIPVTGDLHDRLVEAVKAIEAK